MSFVSNVVSGAVSAPSNSSASPSAVSVVIRPGGGVKGSDVYSTTGAELLDLYVQLNRGCSETVIADAVSSIVSKNDQSLLEDLLVLAFQTRDVRGGKGERDLFASFMKAFETKCPVVTKALLDLIPEFGSWRDMFTLSEKCSLLKDDIYRVSIEQLKRDEAAAAVLAATSAATSVVSSNSAAASSSAVESKEGESAASSSASEPKAKVSLLAKWLPREHCAKDMEAVKALSALLCSGSSTPLRDYRKRVSALNKTIKTLEVTMCDGDWSTLKPSAIPGRALHKYMKAFLNQAVKSEHGRKAPLTDPDRVLCAQNFSELFAKAVKGEAKVHGSDTVFPHELVAKVMSGGPLTSDESNGIEAQWKDIVASVRKEGNLGNVLPMVDVSGSMDGIPMVVAIALGMLIAECNEGPFKDYVLTFHTSPVLHLIRGKTFAERVREVAALPWGGSTNFQAAYNLVLQHLTEQHAAPGEEPKDLIVLTDMGWDQAGGGSFGGGAYLARKTEAVETHIQIARKAFKTSGEAVNGAGHGWAAPRIIVWNLRAEYKDFHATAEEEGVLNLSGWASSMLRVLITKGIDAMTPLAMLQAQLQDPRYNSVRERVRAVLGGTEAVASSSGTEASSTSPATTVTASTTTSSNSASTTTAVHETPTSTSPATSSSSSSSSTVSATVTEASTTTGPTSAEPASTTASLDGTTSSAGNASAAAATGHDAATTETSSSS